MQLLKLKKKLLFVSLSLLGLTIKAQEWPPVKLTPNAVMDTLFDMYGNKVLLRDVMFSYTNSAGSSQKATVTASTSCGYFNVYYANNSGMENSSDPNHIARRNVICQLLSDVSAFILMPSGSTARVNILIDQTSAASNMGAAGVASGYYAQAGSPNYLYPGIADNELWKTIHNGVDSYTGVAPPINLSINGFYHCFMAFDFIGVNFNTQLTSAAGAGQTDLYTVGLHELTHALGFASLINNTGISKFGTYNNYYSRYDLFLKNANNLPLLTNAGACAPVYGQQFNTSVNVNNLAPSVATCTNDIVFAGSANQKCYTPSSFNTGSSLSHFADECHTPPYGVGAYYVMAWTTPSGTTKRFLKQEERMALCDLGYQTNSTYGTSANLTYTTYAGTCNGIQVAGICDGITNGLYTYTANAVSGSATSITIPLANIVSNDHAVALPITASCFQNVYNNGSVAISGGNVVFTSNVGYSGPVVLRYVPKDANNVYGNITYVYGFIYPSGCTPVDPCDMVQNGGFENVSGSHNCGLLDQDVNENCWYVYSDTPDIFTEGCTTPVAYDLGTNTYSTSPSWTSYNGTPNDKVLGLYSGYVSGGQYNEAVQNFLSAPLTNGTVYQLKFKYFNFSGNFYYPGTGLFNTNPNSTPCILSFTAKTGVSLGSNYPTFLNVFSSHTLSGSVNTWVTVSTTFTYTGPSGCNVIGMGHDYNADLSASYTNTTTPTNFYVLLDDVSILPAGITPTLSIPTSICAGQSINDLGQYAQPGGGFFTGTGVTNSGGIYNFNNPATLSTGTYSVSYTYTTTNGCSYTSVANILVNPAPPALTVNSTTICNGNTAVLTANGALTYTWNPTNLTGATVYVTPTVTTNYTVTGTVSGGCTANAVAAVTVIPNVPFTVNATSSNIYPIVGSAVTVSATVAPAGNYTYAWSPNGGNTAGATFTPTNNAVYTCNVTNVCGTVVSTSLCISVQSTLCSVPSQTILNNPVFTNTTAVIANQTITITGTLTINNSSITYTGCTLKMGTNARIIVNPTSSFIFTNSKLFSCESMWYGIEAQSNTASSATINLTGSSIEDAYNAIIADNVSTNICNVIQVISSTLNKNYIDISLNNAGSGSGNCSVYPLLVQSSNLTSTLSVTSPGNSLKCSSFYAPIVKGRSYAGLYANNAYFIEFLNNNISSGFNQISNKDYGLYLKKTTGKVYNVQFKDMLGLASTLPDINGQMPLPIGIAIYSEDSRSLYVNPITTPVTSALVFNNVGYGIITSKTGIVNVLNAEFSNPSQYSYSSFQDNTVTGLGLQSIYIIDATSALRINSNIINSTFNPISFAYKSALYAPALFSISQNSISAGTGTLNIAIDVMSSLSTPFGGATNNKMIAANIISNASTVGIRMLSVTGGGMRLSGNTISLRNLTTGTRDGILLNGNNSNVIVDNNAIDGSLTSAVGSFNLNQAGIRSINSPGCFVQCNTITRVGKGVVYSGNNSTGSGAGTEFFKNTLNYPIRRGLELNNGAILGTQGNSNGASANVWNGFSNITGVDQTMIGGPFPFSANTNAINSILYVHNNTNELPNDNAFLLPASFPNAYALNANIFSTSAADIATCPTILTVGAKLMSGSSTEENIEQRDADYTRYINGLVTPSGNATPEAKWLLKQHMHKSIRYTGMGTNGTVNNFYTLQQNRSVADYYELDSLIAIGELAQAQNKSNAIPVYNYIEQTHHDFNNLYLNGINNSTDYTALETIANLCAYQYGNAVYQARALLNSLSYTNRSFEDSCEVNEIGRFSQFYDKEDDLSVTNNAYFKVYPNPNNGTFTLSYDLKNTSDATVIITDVTGKLVYKTSIESLNNFKTIDIQHYQSGIYFIQLYNNNKGLIWTDKLMINK